MNTENPSNPQPSPAPPRPPRQASHGVLIALLVLALIVVSAVAALIYGVRIISRNVSVHQYQAAGGSKEVSIKTPVGSIDVNQGQQTDPALLGLPVYPGAQRAVDKDSAQVNMDFPGQQTVGMATAKFQTPDAIERVAAYYRNQLSGQISKTTTEHYGQKIVFEIKRDYMEKVVALKTSGDGTEITLVRVRHGAAEAN
ncbi:MAG: hypothetical protein ACRD1I_05785 [Terriglobia bacterium]